MKKLLTILAVALGLNLSTQSEPVDYDALLLAVARVESENGATSKNVYQITRIYWEDVNRFRGMRWHPSSYRDMVECRPVASDYVMLYWEHYGEIYTRRTGNPATAEVLARIHNGGPDGWRKASTADYWKRVKAQYDRIRAEVR